MFCTTFCEKYQNKSTVTSSLTRSDSLDTGNHSLVHLQKASVTETGRTFMVRIIVDDKRCKGCGYCAAFCPKSVYKMGEDNKPIVYQVEKCTFCQMCVKRCPDFAIRIEER